MPSNPRFRLGSPGGWHWTLDHWLRTLCRRTARPFLPPTLSLRAKSGGIWWNCYSQIEHASYSLDVLSIFFSCSYTMVVFGLWRAQIRGVNVHTNRISLGTFRTDRPRARLSGCCLRPAQSSGRASRSEPLRTIHLAPAWNFDWVGQPCFITTSIGIAFRDARIDKPDLPIEARTLKG